MAEERIWQVRWLRWTVLACCVSAAGVSPTVAQALSSLSGSVAESVSLLCHFDPLNARCRLSIEERLAAEKDETERLIAAEKAADSQDTTLKMAVIRRAPAVVVAPMPYVFMIKDGRRVCNKKDDHPAKSDKGKKIHMDMECCLDPDEIPNPHCYYPEEKYGKYLKKFR